MGMDFIDIPTSDRGMAYRFIKRYGNVVKIIKDFETLIYDNGAYKENKGLFNTLVDNVIKLLDLLRN
jgi:hypothetical protein